jgi:hypothetical protein
MKLVRPYTFDTTELSLGDALREQLFGNEDGQLETILAEIDQVREMLVTLIELLYDKTLTDEEVLRLVPIFQKAKEKVP